MLLFRVRRAHSREVQVELQHSSISRMLFRCGCSAYVSHAQQVFCRFRSLLGLSRSSLSAPLQTPFSKRSSTLGSLRRFLLTRREFPPPDSVFALFPCLCP